MAIRPGYSAQDAEILAASRQRLARSLALLAETDELLRRLPPPARPPAPPEPDKKDE